MAENAKLIKNFSEFGGLDKRSHDIDRKPRFARNAQNTKLADNGSLTCRLGQSGIAIDAGGGGTETYIRTNSDRSVTEELVTIDDNLWRRQITTLSIAYAGISENVSFALLPTLNDDESYSFHAFLYEGDTTLLDEDLGIGKDELTSVTLSDLVTAINAVTDFTATTTGTTTIPAAFLNAVLSVALSSSATEVARGMYWEQVYCPTSDPFADFWANVNLTTFENACLFNHNNLLFIARGAGKLYKYDGLCTYAAGMPEPDGLVAASGGAGSLTGTYRYFITYDFYDARGNNIEGNSSNEEELVLSSNDVDLTIPTIRNTTEFLHCFGYANNGGTQTGTTLTLDDGSGGNHTLQVGMTAFFYDNSGAQHEKVITARTGTSITFSGSVTIANNEPISANLRINLWRNKAGDFNKYLVKAFANRPDVATFSYTDNTVDDDLGVQYTAPVNGHALPREDLRYLTVFQNIMVSSDGNASQIFAHDREGPEYTAGEDADFILIRSKSNGPVTGLGSSREILAAFKSDETHALQGDLGDGNFRMEMLADGIGCDAHATIKDVDGSLWFSSEKNGVQRIEGNKAPTEISYRLLPSLRAFPADTEQRFIHKRAVAVDDPRGQQYLLWIPCESTTGGNVYSNDNSRLFSADYRAQSEGDNDYDREGRLERSLPKIRWWEWPGFNWSGGATILERQVVWTSRHYSTDLSTFQYLTVQRLNQGDETDYADFAGSYTMYYEAGWDDLGEPDQDKKFISASIYSFDEFSSPSFNITCRTELDYKNDQTHSEKMLVSEAGGSSLGWGDGPWGDFPWGELEDNRRLFPFKLTRARAVKLVFVADIWRMRPVISGWIIQAAPAYRPKQKK